MPNQRRTGQVLVNFPADQEFLDLIDTSYKHAGFGDRSSFIRWAIKEKLERMNIPVPAGMIAPPSRVGIGGSPSHKRNRSGPVRNPAKPKPSILDNNGLANSDLDDQAVYVGLAAVSGTVPESLRSPSTGEPSEQISETRSGVLKATNTRQVTPSEAQGARGKKVS